VFVFSRETEMSKQKGWLKASDFKESNNTASGSHTKSIRTFKDDKVLISRWRLSFIQRLKVLFTGNIWLVLEHGSQPPEFKDMFNGRAYHQPTLMTVVKPFKR
jgi:hypothetical protein